MINNEKWLVYMLCCSDNSYYTGITNNLNKRIEAHSKGIGARYTKGRGPFKVVYTENCESKSLAAKREYAIKQLSRKEKEILINETSSPENKILTESCEESDERE